MTKENLFERFKKYKINIENVNFKSIEQYKKDITRFFDFVGKNINNNEDIININANNVKDYIEHLSLEKKEPATRNKSLAIIKSFYKYLYSEEDIDVDNKIFFIKKAKLNHKEPLWLEQEEMEKYINSIKCPRTKAMVEMLCYTGMRYSELINITLEDFLNGQAVIVGKGNKQRQVYFGNTKLQNVVYDYIITKRKKIIERTHKETDLLFINNNGNKMVAQNFIRTLKDCAKNVENFNRSKEMSPHKLRHSFITNALLNGEPISVVRDAVGHSSISVTNNYAHSTKKSVEELMNKKGKKEVYLEDEREMFSFI